MSNYETLSDIILNFKQEADGLWYVYGQANNRIPDCGRWATEEEARTAARNWLDLGI